MNKLTIPKGIQASKSFHWKVTPPPVQIIQFSRGFAEQTMGVFDATNQLHCVRP